MSDPIIGIDLGTTNSEVAAFVDGKVRCWDRDGQDAALVRGISPLRAIGGDRRAISNWSIRAHGAQHQAQNGSAETVLLGDKSFTPQEISALILREWPVGRPGS